MQCSKCGKEMNMESPLKEVIDAIFKATDSKPEIGIQMEGDCCGEFQVIVWLRNQECHMENSHV